MVFKDGEDKTLLRPCVARKERAPRTDPRGTPEVLGWEVRRRLRAKETENQAKWGLGSQATEVFQEEGRDPV